MHILIFLGSNYQIEFCICSYIGSRELGNEAKNSEAKFWFHHEFQILLNSVVREGNRLVNFSLVDILCGFLHASCIWWFCSLKAKAVGKVHLTRRLY